MSTYVRCLQYRRAHFSEIVNTLNMMKSQLQWVCLFIMPYEEVDCKSKASFLHNFPCSSRGKIWVLELIKSKIFLYCTDNTSKQSLYNLKWLTQITYFKDILNNLSSLTLKNSREILWFWGQSIRISFGNQRPYKGFKFSLHVCFHLLGKEIDKRLLSLVFLI